MQTNHITPTIAELQPFHEIKCQQTGCESIFTNAGSYELHLQKRHKVQTNRLKNSSIEDCSYYCPDECCIYYFGKKLGGRHFKNMKNLRQHYQKVHCKNFVCEKCGRSFVTNGQLVKHCNESCGKRLTCLSCSLHFETTEALLTHGRRKRHAVTNVRANNRRKVNKNHTNTAFDQETQTNFENAFISDVVHQNHKQTQTEHEHMTCAVALRNDNETQTDILGSAILTSVLDDDINAIHHDIQTQTDLTLQQSNLANSHAVSSSSFFEHILTQTTIGSDGTTSTTATPIGADMHTQTCDAYLLSALGLSDIQTQTNWSSFADQKHDQMYPSNTISTSTSTAGFACDELLVSTETQTSFTQCLLESTDINCGSDTTNNVGHSYNVSSTSEESASTFAHLYTTQHTQTCDLLLDGLFGGQENDLITNFQSTYTQT